MVVETYKIRVNAIRHLTERRYAHTPLVAPVGFEPRLLVMGQVSYHCSTSAIYKGGNIFPVGAPTTAHERK